MFPADSLFADWLCWFCADEDTRLSRPFLLPDGRRVGSNGRIAVVDFVGKDAVDNECSKYHSVIVSAITAEPIKSARVSFADLVAEVGECQHPVIKNCPECKGEKRVPHDCGCHLCEADDEECENCGGTGKAEVRQDRGKIIMFGQAFDRNLLAYILAHCPKVDSVSVHLAKCGESYAVHIVSDKWHALLVCLVESYYSGNMETYKSELCKG